MGCASVEEDDYAFSVLDRPCAAGFIKKFATLVLCTEFLGCTPILSKFGLVIKRKPSGIKRRVVLDAKESGVTQCARKNQRIILPHVLDVVFDALTLGSDGSPIEALVLDVSDAFLDTATPYSGAAIFRRETARSVLLLLASCSKIAGCLFGLGPLHRFNGETRPSGCGHACLPTTNIR